LSHILKKADLSLKTVDLIPKYKFKKILFSNTFTAGDVFAT